MDKDVNEKILRFIEEHLNENLDVDQVAAIAGYSKFHLERIFALENGCTIYKYVKMRRLTEAARQLIFSSRPILDIALNAGYDSQQAFTLAFKKVYEITPKVYRDKNIFTPMMLSIQIASKCNAPLCYHMKNYRKEVYAA